MTQHFISITLPDPTRVIPPLSMEAIGQMCVSNRKKLKEINEIKSRGYVETKNIFHKDGSKEIVLCREV